MSSKVSQSFPLAPAASAPAALSARQADSVSRLETDSPAMNGLVGVQGPADASPEEVQPLEFLLETKHHGSRLPMLESSEAPNGTPRCGRCEVLPAPLVGPGTLHLRVPLSHTLAKLKSHLKHGGIVCAAEGGVISIPVAREVSAIVLQLLEVFLPNEQRSTHVIFQPEGHELSLSDYLETETLATFAARAQGGWLMKLLREEALFTVFQPIVRSQTANGGTPEVHGYECLMRGCVDGKVVPPALMMDIARGADLMFQLDLAARRASVITAARLKVPGKIFINFGPTAIYDPKNCLRSTLALIDRQNLARDRIVFEIIESDHTENIEDVEHLQRIVGYYRDNGFGVAIDDLGAGYAGLNLLNRLRPDYIKLDMELTRDVDRDPYKALITRKILETAQELGAQSIAEGIETREERDWIEAHGADFMQGYYFARPASPPPLL